MATVDKGGTVTLQELVISSLAQTDAVAKLPNKLIYMNLGYDNQHRHHHRDTGCARRWERQYA